MVLFRITIAVLAAACLSACKTAAPPPPRCPPQERAAGGRLPGALRRAAPPAAKAAEPGWRLTLSSKGGANRWWTRWTGLPMEGESAVEVNLAAPAGELSRSSGKIKLTCKGCVVGPMKVNARSPFSITLPRVTVGRVEVEIGVKDGVATFDRVTTRSPDMELSLAGKVTLRSPAGDSRVQAELGVKLSDALKRREPKFALLEMGLRQLKQADGSLLFKLKGRLASLRILPRRAVIVPTPPRPGGGGIPLPRVPSGPAPAAPAPAAPAKVARKVGPHTYRISRPAMNKILGNTTLLARSARIVPSFKAGKAAGFKLFAIRPGSLYAQLGFKNGDVVHRINDVTIDTPDRALEAYTRLRKARKFQIHIARRGRPMTLKFIIR